MCWLIDHALDVPNPTLTLAEIYHQLKVHIPKKVCLSASFTLSAGFAARTRSQSGELRELLGVGFIARSGDADSGACSKVRALHLESGSVLEETHQR